MYDGKESVDARGIRLPETDGKFIYDMFRDMFKREGNWATMLVTKVSIRVGTDDVLVCVSADDANTGGKFVQFAGSGTITGALSKVDMYARTGTGKWSPDRYG